jgi:hypothetical protein
MPQSLKMPSRSFLENLIYRMRVRTRDDAAEMLVKRMDKIHTQAR